MGVFVRRVLPVLILALAAGIGARAAAPDLQTSLRDKFFATLNPAQQKGLPRTSPIDQLIGKMDLQQRQSAAGQLPALEQQFSDSKSLSEIGSVYLKLGDFSAASRVAEALKVKFPDDSRGPLLEAHAKAESGDKEGAIVAAKQAVQADPANAEAVAYFKLLRNGSTQSSQVPLQGTRAAATATRDPGENHTMGERQLERVNSALAMLRRSTHGKRILVAIVPDSDGTVTEADLRENGVHLLMKQEPLVGRAFGQVERKVVEGRQVFIVSINNAVLDERNDTREVSAYVGGKLKQVDAQKKSAEPLPNVLMDWCDRAAQAYILIDLGVEAIATSVSSVFSQELLGNARVVRGQLAEVKTRDGQSEFYSPIFSAHRKTLSNSESLGKLSGIDLLYVYTTLSNNETAVTLQNKIPNYADKKTYFSNTLRQDFSPQ
ncbi:MAG: hypothetical protein A2X36_04855 [Elusimicrobia bacterium GWA2_69_24]|nr:MAG: hypothetical protein A2X36_04855 [Elusimicrobia bacterium GWA2_69_24]HBL17498.1 hypothetical protein [Elusimicrobiota bacterium]